MKWRSLLLFLLAQKLFAQGAFIPSNGPAKTRLGTPDGLLAGTNICAQFFAGSQANSLLPVGLVDFHIDGEVVGPNAIVAGVAPYDYALVQMIAWDSSLWGTNWLSVPSDQVGRSDVVSVYLTTGLFPDVVYRPNFTQAAVVPVPEPRVLIIGAAASVMIYLRLLCRRIMRLNQVDSRRSA